MPGAGQADPSLKHVGPATDTARRPMDRLLGSGKVVGRWIVFVPAAAFVALVTPAAVKFLSTFLAMFYPGASGSNDFLGHIWVEAVAGASSGLGFVYIGAAIAPNKHRAVAIILSAAALFITGAAVLADVILEDYWAAWQGIWTTLGACVTAFLIVKGEIRLGSSQA